MFLDKVKKTITDNNLIEKKDKIIIGLSGGHDSVTLLDVLVKLRKEYNLKLAIAHVNYGFRGRDSDLDEKFVKSLAKKYHLKVYIKNLKQKNYQSNGNLEDYFRKIRYDFFEKVCKKEKGQKIAVAHTLDDQIETILMFFLRGAGLRGLKGMDYKSGKIIRPLLDVSRDEISQYLKENKLKWRKDITNEDISFTRNKIRHRLIPYLKKEFNPNLFQTLKNSSRAIREDYFLIEDITQKHFKKIVIEKKKKFQIKRKDFIKLPISLQRRILLYILKSLLRSDQEIGLNFLDDLLKMILNHKKTGLKEKSGLKIEKKYDKIIIEKNRKLAKKIKIQKPIQLKIPGTIKIPQTVYQIQAKKVNKLGKLSKNISYLDLEKTGEKLFVRSWKEGDRFYPKGISGSQKLQDFFVNNKIPKEERETIPLIVTKDQNIVWIAGYRPDRRFIVNNGTKKILKLALKKN